MFCVFQSKGPMWTTHEYSTGKHGSAHVARDVLAHLWLNLFYLTED